MSDPAVPLLLLTILAWVALEFWKIARHTPTISQEVWDFERFYPEIRFLAGLVIGLLCGHLFWNG